ncbi:MAG: Fis family transcriptional regulator [Deltaproteobacteria bacterium HGW-Deltaproteobacteria-22]|jgi:PAS domain S-box-containing protein|nr:MAG: Fis family transcriptional regulator [Deltaproteobacteria bacterium HGW-Deltaproteobacteria-22]
MKPVVPIMTETILESISDGVFTVDRDWRITSFNRAAELITGIPRREALGRRCADVFRSSRCGDDCPLRCTLADQKPIIGQSCYIVTSEGRQVPISISTAVLRDAAGRIIGGAETFRDLSEVVMLRARLERRHRVGELATKSAVMRRVLEILPAIADSPSTVLITGETGTGKEMLARTIHESGSGAKEPFVAVNCGALPDTLLESELFGYKKGAFTGAVRDKPGRFSLARRGTLFLDEIGEVSPSLQVKLLRVLQERVFEPLGSVRSEPAEARIIAATNRDLSELVRTGRFREDLYYRIHVVSVQMPPLRERREDIPLLVQDFVAEFNHIQNRQVQGVSSEALSLLMAYGWPGNIRELKNAVERAFLLCRTGSIEIFHLPEEITAAIPAGGAMTMRDVNDLIEAQAIRRALDAHGWKRSAAAHELGLHRSTLFRKMRELGIVSPARDGRWRGSR